MRRLENMEIYKLTPDEWGTYKQLRLEALREDPQASGDALVEMALAGDGRWQEEFENPKSFILVAREGAKPLAMAVAYQEDGEKMAHVAYVWGVYVKKNQRGQGIGQKIMEALLEELGKNKEIEKSGSQCEHLATFSCASLRKTGLHNCRNFAQRAESRREILRRIYDGEIFEMMLIFEK